MLYYSFLKVPVLHALAQCHSDWRKNDYKIEKLFYQHSELIIIIIICCAYNAQLIPSNWHLNAQK